MLKLWNKIQPYLDVLQKIWWFIWIFLFGLGFLAKKYIFPFSKFFLQNLFLFFIIFVLSSIIILFIMVFRLHRRFTLGFKDNFRGNLNKNWEFYGDWTIKDKQLSVTNSEAGGITKVGALWENYSFKFKTKILNRCSGWIVRGADISNYFMFQCRHDVIVPHQRISRPVFGQFDEEKKDFKIKGFETGWYKYEPKTHNKDLKDKWFDVEIKVKGSGVQIYIDNDLVFYDDKLITIPMGKVGFRNWGPEHSLFKKVRVYLIE